MDDLSKLIVEKIKAVYQTYEQFSKKANIPISKILKASGNEIGDLTFTDVDCICKSLGITTDFCKKDDISGESLNKIRLLDNKGIEKVYSTAIANTNKS